jgi:hypothetical protein
MTSKWRLLILACTILLTAGMAMADDCGNGKDHGKGTPSCGSKGNGGNGGQGGNGGSVGPIVITNDNINTATASSHSTSNSSSTSNATGGNATATGGNASASQSQTANGGNANAFNGGQSNTQVSTVNQVHQTASAIAPESYPTAPCRVSGSGAGSSPFFGVSFSGSKLDTECEKRETARSFALIGEREAAVQLLCATKAAKAAKLSVCVAPAPVNKQ